jgi:hypothetical protein
MADYDVTLSGTNYMVLPKTYQSSADDEERAKIQRVSATTRQLVRSSGAWPALPPYEGLCPAPDYSSEGSIASATAHPTAFDNTYLFMATGSTLYRWTRVSGVAPTNRRALGATALDMALVGTTLYFAFGSGTQIASWVDSSGTWNAAPFASVNTADVMLAVGPWLLHNDAASPADLIWRYGALTTAVTRSFDSTIHAIVPYEAGFLVITDTTIYYCRANVETGAPTDTITIYGAAQLQDSDDVRVTATWRGRVFAFIAGEVVAWSTELQAWISTGLHAPECHGIAAAGGWLFACVATDAGLHRLYAYDGRDWWLVYETGDTTNVLDEPAPTGDGNLVTFRPSNTSFRLWQPGATAAADLTATVTIVSPPLDAGDPVATKQWSNIGVQFRRDDGSTVGSWSCQLAYSTDGGNSYTNAGGSQTVNAEQQTVSASVTVSAVTLIVRATLTFSSGLLPHVVAAFADARILSDRARKRRWKFAVRAGDNLVDRTGAADARSGQTIRAALWSLWDDASSFTFRDVDYGATSTEYTVRLVALDESWPVPADQLALGAHTQLTVTLVEV